MRTAFLFLLWFYSPLQCLALEPGQPAAAYQHLAEVNRQWVAHLPFADARLEASLTFPDETARIRYHLQEVEILLRNKPTGTYSPEQLERRRHHLDVLHRYWQQGAFPVNRYHTVRRPYFRDHLGTLCAVGYLLWTDGRQDLVERIRRESNYDYLPDLAARYPAISAWARANGFDPAELALIQPAYTPNPSLAQWGNGQGLNPGGRINVMTTGWSNDLYAAGAFSSIQGKAVNNIARWDGQQWHALANGVIGEVYCLFFFDGSLYIGGDFSLPGNPAPCNAARYDEQLNTMVALQSGDMEGTVRTIYFISGELYIGGDFLRVNGAEMPYLARKDGTNAWGQAGGQLSVDAPVRTISWKSGHLLIGGEFSTVCSSCPAGQVQPADFLAYWSYNDQTWVDALIGAPLPVHAAAGVEGYLFTATDDQVWQWDAGLWQQAPVSGLFDHRVHGFLSRYTAGGYQELYVFGGILMGPIVGTYGFGLAQLHGPGGVRGVVLADSTVRAAVFYQGDLYFAGDFTQLQGQPFAGMGIVQKASVGTGTPVGAPAVQVQAGAASLSWRYDHLDGPATLAVFDFQGRRRQQRELPAGSGEGTVPGYDLPAGVYVWQVSGAGMRYAGKWAVVR